MRLDDAGWQHRLATRLELPMVQHARIGLILINALILGMETRSTLMADGAWINITAKAMAAAAVGMSRFA